MDGWSAPGKPRFNMGKPSVILTDSREQTPLDFAPCIAENGGESEWTVQTGTLTHADYSLMGSTDLIAIERKSVPDLIACTGRERERFDRELLALRGYKYKAVVVEGCLSDLEKGKWRGDIKPSHVLGSIASWRVKMGVDFIYCEDPVLCAREVFRLLRKFRDYCADYARRFS